MNDELWGWKRFVIPILLYFELLYAGNKNNYVIFTFKLGPLWFHVEPVVCVVYSIVYIYPQYLDYSKLKLSVLKDPDGSNS